MAFFILSDEITFCWCQNNLNCSHDQILLMAYCNETMNLDSLIITSKEFVESIIRCLHKKTFSNLGGKFAASILFRRRYTYLDFTTNPLDSFCGWGGIGGGLWVCLSSQTFIIQSHQLFKCFSRVIWQPSKCWRINLIAL